MTWPPDTEIGLGEIGISKDEYPVPEDDGQVYIRPDIASAESYGIREVNNLDTELFTDFSEFATGTTPANMPLTNISAPILTPASDNVITFSPGDIGYGDYQAIKAFEVESNPGGGGRSVRFFTFDDIADHPETDYQKAMVQTSTESVGAVVRYNRFKVPEDPTTSGEYYAEGIMATVEETESLFADGGYVTDGGGEILLQLTYFNSYIQDNQVLTEQEAFAPLGSGDLPILTVEADGDTVTAETTVQGFPLSVSADVPFLSGGKPGFGQWAGGGGAFFPPAVRTGVLGVSIDGEIPKEGHIVPLSGLATGDSFTPTVTAATITTVSPTVAPVEADGISPGRAVSLTPQIGEVESDGITPTAKVSIRVSPTQEVVESAGVREFDIIVSHTLDTATASPYPDIGFAHRELPSIDTASADTIVPTVISEFQITLSPGQPKVAVDSVASPALGATIRGNTYFCGESDGNIYAIGAENGTEVWRYSTGSDAGCDPTVVNGVVYGASGDTVFALRATTGDEIWSTQESGEDFTSSGINVVEGAVFVSSQSGTFSYNSTDGSQKWSYNRGDYSATVLDGSVFIYDSSGVVKLDASDGSEEWTYSVTTGNPVSGSPIPYEGRVFVQTDSHLLAIDQEAGFLDWQASAPGDNPSTVVVDSENDRVLVKTVPKNTTDSIKAFNTDDGSQEFSFGYDVSPDSNPTKPLTVADGKIYNVYAEGNTSDNHLDVRNTSDGSLASSGTFTGGDVTSLITAYQGTVAVGTQNTNAQLVRLDESASKLWTFSGNSGKLNGSPTLVRKRKTGKSLDSRIDLATSGNHDTWAFTGSNRFDERGVLGTVYARVEYSAPQGASPGSASVKITNVDKNRVVYEDSFVKSYEPDTSKLFVVNEVAQTEAEDLSNDELELELDVQASASDGTFTASFGDTLQSDHLHPLEPGDFSDFDQDYVPENCEVKVNGTTIGTISGGDPNGFTTSVDATREFTLGATNRVEVTSDKLGNMQVWVEGDVYRDIQGGG